MKKTGWVLCTVWVLALSTLSLSVAAQEGYPSAPIRLILGFPPGDGTDVLARLLAPKLAAQMNANVIVENKPGANGNIGAEFVAKSKPDGYTVMLNTSSVILSRAFDSKLSYDVLNDFIPVARLAFAAQLLVVHPSVPANTAAEFITYLKANPNKLAYGSSGYGNSTHLGALLFLQANGLSALHVPYQGTSPVNIDLVAGRVQFVIQSMALMLPLAKDNRVKVLAIAGLKRSPLMPDVPTLNETVMPGFEMGAWFGVMVPAKTPRAIVQRLNSEIVKALQAPDIIARLAQENIQPIGSTPEEYATYLRSELERWAKVVQSGGLKAE